MTELSRMPDHQWGYDAHVLKALCRKFGALGDRLRVMGNV
jgi:hypothetical protein